MLFSTGLSRSTAVLNNPPLTVLAQHHAQVLPQLEVAVPKKTMSPFTFKAWLSGTSLKRVIASMNLTGAKGALCALLENGLGGQEEIQQACAPH